MDGVFGNHPGELSEVHTEISLNGPRIRGWCVVWLAQHRVLFQLVTCVRMGTRSCDSSMLGSRLHHLGCSIRVERNEQRTEKDQGTIHHHTYVSCQV